MIKKLFSFLKSRKDEKESVFFVTFHKTASSYFGNFILKQSIGLLHKDPASDIFRNKKIEKINYEDNNHIYGPIRLSLKEGPVYEKVVLPILKNELLHKYKAICFIRDPRDIIVSFYYSQAYSHPLSNNEDIKLLQIKNRDRALIIGIDKYALEEADFFKEKFEMMISILESNKNSLLLKYEDMIYDFDSFHDQLSTFIELPSGGKEIIYENTRPKNEGIHSHRRNGQKNGYKKELQDETIVAMNNKLRSILNYFDYEV